MPTIKVKKEMNLPQLIEWIIENDTTYEQYEPMLVKGLRFVAVDGYGDIRIHGFVRPDDIFTIEIEKEITEDTVFDKLISRYVFLSSKPSYAHAINVSIKEVIEDRKKATHIYFENEDNELQLIWKNGRLVE